MNYKKGIYIKDSILIDYFLPQKEVIKDIIDDDLKKAISFEWKDKEIYIRFKINRVIIFKLENNIVESIEVLDYNHVLNEEFLDNLINNASKLDSNLRNVASYEYIDILKEEMINILNLNEVKIHYNEDIDVFIGELEYTDVKFFINKQFQFKGVIKA